MTTLRLFQPQDLLKMNLTNLDPLTENYDVNFYLQYHTKWPSLFIVAEDQHGNIIGYIFGKLEEDPIYFKIMDDYMPWHGHITALTVAPQYRRLGLAQDLTKALERGCEEQNAWFVDLFVRESNPAVEMYKKIGYSVFRRVVDYYSDNPTGKGDKSTEDAFDMRKSLSRDKKKQHIREDGENHRIQPEDLHHG